MPGLSLVAVSRAHSLVVHGLLIAVASPVVEHGLSCPEAYRIFLDQGVNPCPLHWQGILHPWTTREVPEEYFA